jgi:hypothetical protein
VERLVMGQRMDAMGSIWEFNDAVSLSGHGSLREIMSESRKGRAKVRPALKSFTSN